MFHRAPLTVVLLTSETAVRADFAKDGKLIQKWRADQIAGQTLATRIESVLRLAPDPPGKKTLVLTSQAWTQNLRLAPHTVADLSPEELAQSLKYETESFSGIPANQSRLAFVEQQRGADYRSFLVAQLPATEMDDIEERVSSLSSKLIGITSPYCLPAPLQPESNWQRIEFWSDAVCGVRNNQCTVAHGHPKSDRWREILEFDELDVNQTTECLVDRDVGVPHEHLTGTQFALDADEQLEAWLAQWAGFVIRGEASRLSCLVPPSKPVSPRHKVVVAATLATVLMFLCVLHHFYQRSRIQAVLAELNARKFHVAEEDDFRKRLQLLVKQQPDLESKVDRLQTQRVTLNSLLAKRDRIKTLLSALASAGNEQLAIEKIDSTNEGLRILGESVASDAASRFARDLKSQLHLVGWDVQAPRQTGRNQLLDGGPWKFEIDLLDGEVPPRDPVRTLSDHRRDQRGTKS